MEQKQKEFEKRVAEDKERQDRWMAERRKEFEQLARDSANGKNARRNEIIKQTLELTDAQWNVIEPKINKVYFLGDQAGIKIKFSGGGYSGGGASGFRASPAGRTHSAGTGADSGRKVQSSGSGSAGVNPVNKDGWQTAESSTNSWTVGKGGGGGSGVGQAWSGPLWRLADRELTEGEKTCEELQKLLDDKKSQQAQIDQKIDALRRARENAAKELAKARQELREVLTPRQQARLVLAGVLD